MSRCNMKILQLSFINKWSEIGWHLCQIWDKDVDLWTMRLNEFASIVEDRHRGLSKAATKGTVYLRLRAYLRESRRAGMWDPDRALRRIFLSNAGASRHEPEVARAQQVLQVPRFLPQHVFPGTAYLSLGIYAWHLNLPGPAIRVFLTAFLFIPYASCLLSFYSFIPLSSYLSLFPFLSLLLWSLQHCTYEKYLQLRGEFFELDWSRWV